MMHFFDFRRLIILHLQYFLGRINIQFPELSVIRLYLFIQYVT